MARRGRPSLLDMKQTGRTAEAGHRGKLSGDLTAGAPDHALSKDVPSAPASVAETIKAALHAPTAAKAPAPNKLVAGVSPSAIQAQPATSAASVSSKAVDEATQGAARDEGAREPAPSKSTAPSDLKPVHAELKRAASALPEQSEAAVDRAETGAGTASATGSNQPSPLSPASSEVIVQGKGAQSASGWRGRTPTQAEVFAGPLSVARAAVQANVTVWSYLRKESEAALAHFRALSSAKTPADAISLQTQEMTRALNAALNLGSDLSKSARQLAEGPSLASKDRR